MQAWCLPRERGKAGGVVGTADHSAAPREPPPGCWEGQELRRHHWAGQAWLWYPCCAGDSKASGWVPQGSRRCHGWRLSACTRLAAGSLSKRVLSSAHSWLPQSAQFPRFQKCVGLLIFTQRERAECGGSNLALGLWLHHCAGCDLRWGAEFPYLFNENSERISSPLWGVTVRIVIECI